MRRFNFFGRKTVCEVASQTGFILSSDKKNAQCRRNILREEIPNCKPNQQCWTASPTISHASAPSFSQCLPNPNQDARPAAQFRVLSGRLEFYLKPGQSIGIAPSHLQIALVPWLYKKDFSRKKPTSLQIA